MKISAVMIVKNEEALLANCLESLKGVDEIIIADTGSIDNTIEVAKRYTDKIYTEKKWEDDFAACRNFALSKATGDWVLSIDADEILHDYFSLHEAVAIGMKNNYMALDCTLIAADNGQAFLYPRLFKRDPAVYWVGNIHNHLSTLGSGICNVRITHGYSPAHNLDPDRAFRILKKEVDNRGYDNAVRESFYLGREYYYRQDYQNSVRTLGQYVQRSAYLAEKAEAFLIMSKAYQNMGMWEDSRDAILQAIKINANFKEAIVQMAVLAGLNSGNDRWESNAKQWLKMAETANNFDVLFVRNLSIEPKGVIN